MLEQAGWKVQSKKQIDFTANLGIAVREYQTDVGPADYLLFVDKNPVGVIEAKPEDWGQKITTVEDQAAGYAAAKLKWLNNKEPLPFIYESTGVVTRFTDSRDPKPRSREVFNFHRPETMKEWLAQPASLRARLQAMPVLDPSGLRACQIAAIEKLEESFKDDRPRALVQMATGAGKTYTAITAIYRLLKHADAKRILFLVDTTQSGTPFRSSSPARISKTSACEVSNPRRCPPVTMVQVPVRSRDTNDRRGAHRPLAHPSYSASGK
jgi:type I restriction enzyme R subunit